MEQPMQQLEQRTLAEVVEVLVDQVGTDLLVVQES
tara:strand:- start:25 stop:129 length:105 start_codon:yes stop_codon:yes gene_type:complete